MKLFAWRKTPPSPTPPPPGNADAAAQEPAAPVPPPPVRSPVDHADPGVRYWPVRRAFGLDISDASLKVVELEKKGGGYTVVAHNRVDLPPDVIQRGEILNPHALREAITGLLQGARPRPITAKHVLLSFPETNVYLHPFEFPKALTEAQVRRAVPYEAEGELPITLSDMYADIQFHRSREKAHHVLFAAAPQSLVHAYMDVLVSAGLAPVVFEIESLALARCLIRPQDDPVLLLDIGASSSTISMVERGMVHGAVSIPAGGVNLTETLASTLGVSREEAEREKREKGLEGVPPDGQRVMMDILTPLVAEVLKAATYHETHTGRPVTQLVLSGGTALLKGIVPFLVEQTKLAVSLGDPLAIYSVGFASDYSEHDRAAFSDERIVYINSIGLAIRGATPELLLANVNLLPPRIKARYQQWSEHILATALSALVVLALLTAPALLGFRTAELVAERGRLLHERQLLETSFADPRFSDAVKEAAEVNAEITTLRQFDEQRVNVSEFLAGLRTLLSPAVRVSSLHIAVPPDKEKPVTVTVNGIAARREDFLAFEGALRSRNDIVNVDSPVTNLNRAVDAPFTVTLTLAPASPTPLPVSSPLP